jgi:rare lipoprotein A
MRALLAAMIVCALARSAPAEIASCYGREHHQLRTASGESYDPSRLSAAHRWWRFGTRVLVTNLRNGRSVTVLINDRGPAAWTHRAIDLSLGACRAIGNSGLARVSLQIVGEHHEAHSRFRPRHRVRRRRG